MPRVKAIPVKRPLQLEDEEDTNEVTISFVDQEEEQVEPTKRKRPVKTSEDNQTKQDISTSSSTSSSRSNKVISLLFDSGDNVADVAALVINGSYGRAGDYKTCELGEFAFSMHTSAARVDALRTGKVRIEERSTPQSSEGKQTLQDTASGHSSHHVYDNRL